MSETKYDKKFFAFHEERSRESAKLVIPALFEFIRPASVVDVGCGIGTWLAEFKLAGVADYLGIDGDYVDRQKLLVEPSNFLAHDLAKPIELERRFDLAVSLEVAEHLPSESADTFVASLVKLAPVVLFSAAIPFQRGTGHINEQWPEYWNARFQQHDYQVVDCLRRPLWRDRQIASWYRQNMLIFVERAQLADYPALAAAVEAAGPDPPLAMVHPTMYLERQNGWRSELRLAHCEAMRHILHLRKWNVVAFPDWSRPEGLRDQLVPLLAAVASHRDRASIALVLPIGAQRADAVAATLRTLSGELPRHVRTLLAEGPTVSTVDASFNREQWEVLCDCLQGRIVLAGEDAAALAEAGADSVQALSLAQVESGQPLGET